jgi:hypothetical protein
MAKNIIQRITLEGGAAIKAQLEAIGTAGKKAFGDLQQAVQSNRGFANVGAAIDGVKAKASQMSVAGKQLTNDIGELGGGVTKLAGLFGVTLVGSLTGVVAGVAAMVRGTASAEKALLNAADAAGTTTDKIQELTFAAGKVNLDQDDIVKVLTRINRLSGDVGTQAADFQKKWGLAFQETRDSVNDLAIKWDKLPAAQRDNEKETEQLRQVYDKQQKTLRRLREEQSAEINIFTRLGVAIRDSNGDYRDSADILNDVADAISQIPSKAERAALALQITGARNSKFNALIEKGSEGLANFRKEMERVAPATTPLQIAVGARLDSAFKGLQATITSTKTAVLTLFAPAETRLVKAFQDLIVENREKLLSMAAAIVDKVTPIVDDLIAVLQGRDKDVKNNIILVIRDAIVNFAKDAQSAITGIIIPALSALLKVLDTVAKAINGLFGTNLTGGQIAIAILIAKAIGIFGLFSAAIKVAIGALGLLSTALGGPVALAIAAIAFAIGFVLVRALASVNWKAFADFAASAWESIKAGVSGVGTWISDAFNSATKSVGDAWSTTVEFVKTLWNGLLDFFAGLPTSIGNFFVSVGNTIVSAFNAAVDTVKGFFDSLWLKVTGIFDAIIAKARRVAAAASSIFGGDASGSSLASDLGINSFARGGFTGRGGKYQPAGIVHRGEYVMPIEAVKKWGVGFMHAIRAGIDPFQGFANGGFVDALASVGPRGLPAFANGGASAADGSALRPVIFQLDGRSFASQMSEDVLSELTQFATTRRVRASGKKPGWVGG